MTLPSEFDFLKDTNFDGETKRILLQGLFEERRLAREAEQRAKANEYDRDLERKKFWHNTPLMLALVGTITVFANGLVAYVQTSHTTADTVTLKELDAKRAASREERVFAFKVIEQELGKASDAASRAEVLLFLVRAGVLNSLNKQGLEQMAEKAYATAGGRNAGIPPTLGRSSLTYVDADTIQYGDMVRVTTMETQGVTYVQLTSAHGDLLPVKEPLSVVLARFGTPSPLVKLTRLGGEAVWLRHSAVTEIRLPREGEYPMPVPAVVMLASGHHQSVKESVDEVRALVASAK